jgi:hypothetical protein
MTFIAAFDAGITGLIYDLRLPIAIASMALVVVAALVSYRLGWFAAARRHPGRAAVLIVATLVVALPVGFYTISPLFLRSSLVEEGPIVVAVATPVPTSTSSEIVGPTPGATFWPSDALTVQPTPARTPEPTPFATSIVSSGEFSGTDEFHFGSGTASIIETAPGTYTLRLADFSVRNGPDLFVYLSPDADGYTSDSLELGRLKATDGSFNYELPAGADPADFASVLIWCKQFAHLFAVAPLVAR